MPLAKVEREVDQDAIKKVYRTVLGVYPKVTRSHREMAGFPGSHSGVDSEYGNKKKLSEIMGICLNIPYSIYFRMTRKWMSMDVPPFRWSHGTAGSWSCSGTRINTHKTGRPCAGSRKAYRWSCLVMICSNCQTAKTCPFPSDTPLSHFCDVWCENPAVFTVGQKPLTLPDGGREDPRDQRCLWDLEQSAWAPGRDDQRDSWYPLVN